jgi:YVTN family beta-propeller protein
MTTRTSALATAVAGWLSAVSPSVAADAHAAPPPSTAVRVYVSNELGGDLSVIDAASGKVVDTIAVGKRPRGLHVTRDGKTVFVALSGSPIAGPHVKDKDLPPADKKADGIGVVDVATGKFTGKIASGSDPEGFAMSRDERLLFVSNEDEGETSIVDVSAGKVAQTVKVGAEPEGVTLSPDGRRVYVTCETTNDVHVIDVATRAVVAKFETAYRPRGIAFLPDGSKAYVTCENSAAICVINVASHKVTKTLTVQGENVRPMGVAVSPDGARAYVTTGRGGSVVVVGTKDDAVEKVIPNVGARVWGVGVSPDGRTVYTANGPSNDVTVIDAVTLAVKAKIPVGQSPWGIAIGGGGAKP